MYSLCFQRQILIIIEARKAAIDPGAVGVDTVMRANTALKPVRIGPQHSSRHGALDTYGQMFLIGIKAVTRKMTIF